MKTDIYIYIYRYWVNIGSIMVNNGKSSTNELNNTGYMSLSRNKNIGLQTKCRDIREFSPQIDLLSGWFTCFLKLGINWPRKGLVICWIWGHPVWGSWYFTAIVLRKWWFHINTKTPNIILVMIHSMKQKKWHMLVAKTPGMNWSEDWLNQNLGSSLLQPVMLRANWDPHHQHP